MKKPLLIIIVAIIIIVLFITGLIMKNNSERAQVKKENVQYEKYLDKVVNGADVASLINKVVEENKKNNIPKDDNGRYIVNGENSLRVDITMVTIEKVYPMETIVDNDVIVFVQNFGAIEFKCTSIEYHKKTGRVSTIMFEEVE